MNTPEASKLNNVMYFLFDNKDKQLKIRTKLGLNTYKVIGNVLSITDTPLKEEWFFSFNVIIPYYNKIILVNFYRRTDAHRGWQVITKALN